MNLNFFKRKKTRNHLELVFKYRGHKFYSFKNVAQIPVQRTETVFYRLEEVKLGVTKADNLAFMDLMSQMVTTDYVGDQRSLIALIDYFDNLLKQDFNIKPIMHVGTAVVLIDDEPENKLTERHQYLKGELIKQSDKVRDFFLKQGMDLCLTFNKEWNPTEVWEIIQSNLQNPTEATFLKKVGSSINDYKVI